MNNKKNKTNKMKPKLIQVHCRLSNWEAKVKAALARGDDVKITGFDYSRFHQKLLEIAQEYNRDLSFKDGVAFEVASN